MVQKNLMAVELPPPFTSPDDAARWLDGEVAKLEAARAACDTLVPLDSAATMRQQQRAQRVYLLRYGAATGAGVALLRAGLISEAAYEGTLTRAQRTLFAGLAAEVVR